MTVEKFQDSISLLPTDLIAETDRLRCAPRKAKIHWGRWASLAACIAVMLYSSWLLSSGIFTGSSADTAAVIATVAGADAAPASAERTENFAVYQGEAAPEEAAAQEILEEETGANQKCEIAGTTSGNGAEANACLTPSQPGSTISFDSHAVMVIQTREELEDYFRDFGAAFQLVDLFEKLSRYDADWFTQHDLLLIRTITGAEDFVPGILGLTRTEEESWEVTLSSDGAGENEVQWHLWMELEKNRIPDGTNVTIAYEQEG